MLKTYTDYHNKIAISVPRQYIDVRTGETQFVSSNIMSQIEYHANNNSLHHLIFSALNSYLNSKKVSSGNIELLGELSEIRKILRQLNISSECPPTDFLQESYKNTERNVSVEELENILEAFGG